MKNAIKSAIKSGHGEAIIYAGAIGLLISDILPTPADGIYFYAMQKNKAKLQSKEITPKQFWRRETALYYGLNPVWWGIVLGAMYFTKGSFTAKIKVGIGIISAGVVVGVINRNIRKDEEFYLKAA